MIDPGVIYLADLGDEQRRPVLVISDRRFNNLAGRVLVVPVIAAADDDLPWRVVDGDQAYAADRVLSISAERVMTPSGQASVDSMRVLRTALALIAGC